MQCARGGPAPEQFAVQCLLLHLDLDLHEAILGSASIEHQVDLRQLGLGQPQLQLAESLIALQSAGTVGQILAGQPGSMISR
ncbi:MAG: hypothetical protein DI604_11730 [Delftia acidovorans]|nr:MAG: hypothetical protein DI604_11730 [Delftia acidovorans]